MIIGCCLYGIITCGCRTNMLCCLIGVFVYVLFAFDLKKERNTLLYVHCWASYYLAQFLFYKKKSMIYFPYLIKIHQ